MIFGNKTSRSVIVVELINCDVDRVPLRLEPNMGLCASLAVYGLRLLVPMLVKIFCQKQAYVVTRSKREGGERDWKSFRVAINYPAAEFDCETIQVAWVTVHSNGYIGFTKQRPRHTSPHLSTDSSVQLIKISGKS